MKDIEQLRQGVAAFLRDKRGETNGAYRKLVDYGQRPRIFMIACCDSRVDPALVTSANPGDIFVSRNVANLVPAMGQDSGLEETPAALDYAVNALKVKHILIKGHSRCGGIQGATDAVRSGKFPDGPLGDWLKLAEPAVRAVLDEQEPGALDEDAYCACGRRSVLRSRDNLMTYPWIAEKVNAGELFLHAWYFNLGKLEMEEWRDEEKTFVPLH